MTIETSVSSVCTDTMKRLRKDGYATLPWSSNPVQTQHDNSIVELLAGVFNNLELDPYLPGGASYRRRSYARFRDTPDDKRPLLTGSPSYTQSEDVNPIAGGLVREFPILDESILESSFLGKVISMFRDTARCYLNAMSKSIDIDVHFVRISSTADEIGLPCPEGVHSDGLDFIAICHVDTYGVIPPATALYASDSSDPETLYLTADFEMLFVDDTRVKHYTFPLQLHPGVPRGHRDVILLGATLV